jgi:heat shock protein HtpX
MAAYGLYTHIQSNRRRSIALLIGLFLLVYVLVYAGALVAAGLSLNADLPTLMQIAWIELLKAAPFATIGTLIWIFIAYRFHQSMIDAITGGREVTRTEEPRLYTILENLCISRGITTPKLKIIDTDALNAFATGMNDKQYSITVTTGLLKRLNDDEIEAVLGHELTHIRNGDVRMMVVAVIIAGVVSFFVELVFRLWFWNGFSFRSSRDERRGGGGGAAAAILIAVALLVVAYVLSFVIRLALSRSREFLADAGSVELTKNPDAMISALRKIEGRGELPGATSSVMEMCMDNPREGFGDLFATHPSVDSRVAALIKFAGGHDPGPLALPPLEDETQDGSQTSEQGSEQGGDQGDQAPGPWGPAATGGTAGPDLSPSGTGDNAPPPGPWSAPAPQPSFGPSPAAESPSQAPPTGPATGPAAGPWGPHRSN